MKMTQIAFIREADCIGCTKCIDACPVDAIIGASKYMHTVLIDACIGCKLCVPPCPMDCIELHALPLPAPETRLNRAKIARTRITQRQARLERQRTNSERQYQLRKTAVIQDAKEQLEALLNRTGKSDSTQSNRSEPP